MKSTFAPDKNTSATGGYLRPASVELNDDSLMDLLQSWFVGLTGLDKDRGVIVEFQKDPPPQADAEESWLAIGMGPRDPDFDPFIMHVGAQIPSGVALEDSLTGILYSLAIVSGQLKLVPASNSRALSSFVLLDMHGGAPFTVAVYNGIVQVQAGGIGGAESILLSDTVTQAAFLVTITDGQLIITASTQPAPSAYDLLYQNEVFDIDCSAYGPRCDAIYAAIWNNSRIGQNREALQLNQIGLVRIDRPTPLNEQLPDSNRWIRRVDFRVRLRRAVTLTYPVEDIASAEIVTIIDTPPYKYDQVVTED
jgi:hypothetical protein